MPSDSFHSPQTRTLTHTTDPLKAAEALEGLAAQLRDQDADRPIRLDHTRTVLPCGARDGFVCMEPTEALLCVYLGARNPS